MITSIIMNLYLIVLYWVIEYRLYRVDRRNKYDIDDSVNDNNFFCILCIRNEGVTTIIMKLYLYGIT